MSSMLLLFITIPVCSAFLIMLASKFIRRAPEIIGVAAALACLILSLSLYFYRTIGNVLTCNITFPATSAGIFLVLDGFSHLVLLIVCFISFIAAVYSISYMDKYTSKDKYYILFMLMLAGMNGVLLTGDFINMFIFLELASVASVSLVAFGTERKEMEAALKYIVLGTLASMLILLAIALIYGCTGTVNMAGASSLIFKVYSPLKAFIALLFIVGFSTKAALMPFHAWLPDAHPSAPAPISAMLSGVLIKSLGIYGMVRVIFNVLGISSASSEILMLLGALSILGGSFLAIGQLDMKRMMACSTLSQIGYIVLGIFLATPMGLIGGLLHLFNHAMIKPLLFLTAGAVEQATGTRKMNEMGQLRQSMPYTSNSSLIASLSLSGIPPFNGFWSKLFIIFACIQAGRLWYAVIAIVGSILTLSYMLRMQKMCFFSGNPARGNHIKDAHWTMVIPMLMLALCCVVSGLLFAYVIAFLIAPAAVSIAGGMTYGTGISGGF